MSEFKRDTAQPDRFACIECFVGYHRMWLVENSQSFLRLPVRDHPRASLFESLPTGNVVEMVVTVNQVTDGLVRDLPDFRKVLGSALRPSVPYGIRSDHTFIR